ncbi:hypothetical protein DYB28_011383 [Aphanomyces astaci]|uniref:Uncharacterized protein n=1 Tax=Aphanomyces astaci TaxID=112090 RepID=A0A396ZYM7_APHAT|nr:hypothetical protein AaE_006828 [Aphanomyces astaci]RHX98230.1 hypothetical protein DYB25_003063 [Aphanomyces astaci]RHY13390.1 hypothetical protein DYB36_000873 [Aphanomyces astaci]RHY40048.1 hypothetical protein DYB34_002286 [Aphanomyces astaci]RHY49548.1 hypothetical protein DYB38_005998 [Aphanomyces astaci]
MSGPATSTITSSSSMNTAATDPHHQLELLRAQLAQLAQEKLDMQTRYQRRIDFLERQVEALRAPRSFINRRRSSSMSSSDDCGSGDWTFHATPMSSRHACSMVDEQGDTAVVGPLKRNWKDMLKHLLGNKRSRDADRSSIERPSLWKAQTTTNGKIVFVNPDAKPAKKRRGVSGESSWI